MALRVFEGLTPVVNCRRSSEAKSTPNTPQKTKEQNPPKPAKIAALTPKKARLTNTKKLDDTKHTASPPLLPSPDDGLLRPPLPLPMAPAYKPKLALHRNGHNRRHYPRRPRPLFAI